MPAAERPSRERIGPYRIVARVGAGGMGEVFKAWDPRLERDVAIKILHPQAADADQQRRLLAEGRAASALNHPNILRVYDADVDGDSYYLVSEWLEGRSLRDELSRGALAVKRVLELSVQIADGLAAAHAMGIVHRDIKPENVMLARDGTARIVDFGLARLDPSAATTQGNTASTVTIDGGLSGTPAYMSPEQARGQAGDFRTDQFSFGALMYELATGRHAFRRDTMADTLSAVLHDEPKAIASINPRVPVPLMWVIEQCLAKDAVERYAATEDVARELRRLRDRLRETAGEETATIPAAARRWKLASAGLAAALVVATLGVASMAPAPAIDLRFTPFASNAAYEGTPVWSPDGQSLAWVADVDGVLQIFARRRTDAVATQLTRGRFDGEEPFWAPDGRSVYFISPAGESTGLWRVGTAGGRAELVIENVNYAAIDPTGTRLALLRNKTSLYQDLWWASASGENLRQETRSALGESGFGLGGQLRFSPDGRQLLVWLFIARPGQSNSASAFYLIDTDPAGEVKTVLTSLPSTANRPPFSWWHDNRHVIVGVADPVTGARHLWLADTQTPAMRRITATHTNETSPSAAPDGTIAYASEEVDFDLVALSPDGRDRRVALDTARNEMDPAWAPAGDQYAFVTDRSGSMEIWVRSRDGQWERPLVTQADFKGLRTETFGALAYSPDGRTLAFQRRGTDRATVWLVPAAGGTPVQILPDDRRFNFIDAPAWSPDGEWIALTCSNGPQFSLAKVRVGGTAELVTLVDEIVPFSRSAWSPDGESIAIGLPDGLGIVPVGGGNPHIVSPDPMLAFTWAPDSRRIIGLQESETLGHVAFVEVDARTRELNVLNPDLGGIPVANQPIRGFSLVKGQGILTSLARARSDIWLLEGFELPVHPLLRWLRR